MTSPHAPILERPFHFITVLWGRTYSDAFLEYCVPSFLAPGNLPTLSTRQRSKFVIATTKDDWEYLSSSVIFGRLQEYVEPVFFEIGPCPPEKSGCEHMGSGHIAACGLAYKDKAYAVIVTPDLMISDGTIRHLQEHAARGIELVWVAALRFAEEPFLGHLNALGLIPKVSRRDTGTPLVITGAQMAFAAINGMHTETLSYEWDASYFPHIPSAVWWRVPGENGILVYSLSWAPFLLDFGAVKSHDITTLQNWTIDGDYVYKNLGSNPKIHVVQDSDEMFCGSWAPLHDRAIDLKPRYTSRSSLINSLKKGREFREAFFGPIFDPLKRRIFFNAVRWHAAPLNSRWHAVERKSRRQLRFHLSRSLDSMDAMPISSQGFPAKKIHKIFLIPHYIFGIIYKICSAAFAVYYFLERAVFALIQLMGFPVRVWDRFRLVVEHSLVKKDVISKRISQARKGDSQARKRIIRRVWQLGVFVLSGRHVRVDN